MTIWAHTLVRNEERYLWYAVMSVIDFVDKILIWDTGSTDKTREIIAEIKKERSDKVEFREYGEVTPETFTKVRQDMLDRTQSDWLIIVDGDEVWWEDSIRAIVQTIQKEGNVLESIVNPYYNIIGDIYHYQEEAAGRYKIDGRRGHINIRAMKRSIHGLHFKSPHGKQGVYDENEILIQERSPKYRKFLDAAYLHFTNVPRSRSYKDDVLVPKRKMKLKYELGIPFPRDFYYPEVFFKPRPPIVPSPWVKQNDNYIFKAMLQTPFKLIKRRFALW